MPIPHEVCAATACFPGYSVAGAVERLQQGIEEPVIGRVSVRHIQLCPQSACQLTEQVCENLRAQYPHTQFRLHANARVLAKHVLLDASTLDDQTMPYYEALADRSKRLGAPAYTLHAGYRCNATLAQMRDAVHRLTDLFQIPVGIEGLYANRQRPQLIDTWDEYAWLLDQRIDFAIDLSHLKIVAVRERVWKWDVVTALLQSPHCIEVHVSDNDGRADQHRTLQQPPVWQHMLSLVQPDAVIFTEGNQLRRVA